MRPTDAAWLAGFFDGEGCLVIRRTTTVAAQVVTTDPASRDHCHALMRGAGWNATVVNRHVADPEKHAQSYLVAIRSAAQIAELGRLLLPYAVTKRRQWEVMVAFCEARPGGRRRTLVERERDATWRERLLELNRRGPR